jgi:hypothetical protein
MGSGFTTWKDILDVALIPIALGVATLLWPSAQTWRRRRSFQQLISRELRELSPRPEKATPGSSWARHQTKEFVHKRIFDQVSENREFVLSLPADWIYPVSQLWIARQTEDSGQWLYYLGKLCAPKYDRTGQVRTVLQEWRTLIEDYHRRPAGPSDTAGTLPAHSS